MDTDSIFRRPGAPGAHKRKLATADTVSEADPRDTRRYRAENGWHGAGSSEVEYTMSLTDMEIAKSVPTGGGAGIGKGAASKGGQGVEMEEEEEDNEREEEGRFYGDGLDEDYRELLELVDSAENIQMDRPNAASARRMLLKLESCITKNQELRIKFPDDPLKFGESEADLDEAIKHLLSLSQSPECYSEFIKLNTLPSLLGLLGHENTDIAIDVIELLQELLDDEAIGTGDNEEVVKEFTDALIEQQAPEMLVQNLKRLDEKNPTDRQGVFSILGVMENIVSVDSAYADRILASDDFLTWLLDRILSRQSDSNRNYASELLAILVQESHVNRRRVVAARGIDTLLRALALYKRRDPEDIETEEHVENLFNVLCSALLEPAGRQAFLEAEGVELMIIMLREKRFARLRAPKVLSHAVSGQDPTADACCVRLVEARGLGSLFSAFMQKGNRRFKKAYKSFSKTEDEEYIVTIFAALFRSLPDVATIPTTDTDIQHDTEVGSRLSTRDRLLFKFLEENMAKLDRLLELRETWQARVAAVDEEIARKRRLRERKRPRSEEYDESDEDDIELNPEVIYLQRLEAGLFTLQMIDLVIAEVCLLDHAACEHARMLLRRNGHSFGDIQENIEEYAANLGDGDDENNGEATKQSMLENTQLERVRATRLLSGLNRLTKSEGKRPANVV